MGRDSTFEATFVCVSLHAATTHADPETVRRLIHDARIALDGFVVPRSDTLTVGFDNGLASEWVQNVVEIFGRDCSNLAIGVDRGVVVTGEDFLTGDKFLRSDAVDRAHDLARLAKKGTVAVGLDAMVAEESWDDAFELRPDPSSRFRCKTANLAVESQNESMIPQHTIIGRDTLLGELFDTFMTEPYVWLTGATGVGKSAVASHFAKWWHGTLKRDVVWIDAKRFKTLDDVVFEFGRQLGVQLQNGRDYKTVINALGHRRDLLAVVDEADLIHGPVDELLAAKDFSPLRVLITTRETDATVGVEVKTPPLPTPAVTAIIAGRLARPVADEDITRLAEACSGRPALARWAAAQCAHHNPDHIIAELNGETRSLTVTGVFENTFSFSWARLDRMAREVVRFLAAFEGGATFDAIAQAYPNFDLDAQLNNVDFKSFAKFDADDDRIQLFPFAAKFVEGHVPLEPEHRQAHAEYYVKNSKRLLATLDTRDELRAINEIRNDIANYRAALETVWESPAQVKPIVSVFEKILRVGGVVPGVEELAQKLVSEHSTVPEIVTPSYIVLLRRALSTANFDDADAYLAQLKTLFDRAKPYRSEILIAQTQSLHTRSDIDTALEKITEAVEHSTDQVERWRAESMHGIVLFNAGKVNEAASVLRNVVAECDVPSTRARVCKALSTLLADQDALEEADGYYGYVSRYCEQVGDRREQVAPMIARARAMFRADDVPAALELLETTVEITTRLGVPRHESIARIERSLYLVLNGQLVQGLEEVELGLQRSPSRTLTVQAEVVRTVAFAKMGAVRRAEAAFQAVRDAQSELARDYQNEMVDFAEAYLVLALANYSREHGEPNAGKLVQRVKEIGNHIDAIDSTQAKFLAKYLFAELSQFEHPENRVVLEVARDGRWFQRVGETRVDITRRTALKRLIVGLVEQHHEQPGTSVSLDDAFEMGWPGEKALEQSKIRRVYSTVNRLRNLGFQEILTSDGGYLIDPAVRIEFVDERV